MVTPNNLSEIKEKLSKIGQEHIFDFYSELSEAEQAAFLRQIQSIDIDEFKAQVDRLVLSNEKEAEFNWDKLKPADYILYLKMEAILLCGIKQKRLVKP